MLLEQVVVERNTLLQEAEHGRCRKRDDGLVVLVRHQATPSPTTHSNYRSETDEDLIVKRAVFRKCPGRSCERLIRYVAMLHHNANMLQAMISLTCTISICHHDHQFQSQTQLLLLPLLILHPFISLSASISFSWTHILHA